MTKIIFGDDPNSEGTALHTVERDGRGRGERQTRASTQPGIITHLASYKNPS